jgi:hypothetical protein
MLVSGFEPPDSSARTLQVDVEALTSEVCQIVAAEYAEWPHIRIWKCGRRGIPEEVLCKENEVLFDSHKIGETVYVEKTEDEDELPEGVIRIWAKGYFPGLESPFQFVGCFSAWPNGRIDSLFEEFNQAVGFPAQTPLIVFEEPLYGSPKLLDNASTFRKEAIDTGGILVFQQSPGGDFLRPTGIEIAPRQALPEKKRKEEKEVPDPSVPLLVAAEVIGERLSPTFDRFLSFNVELFVITVALHEDPLRPLFHLTFPSTWTTSELNPCVAKAAGIPYDPETTSLLFFHTNSKGVPGKVPLRPDHTGCFLFRADYCEDNFVCIQVQSGLPESELARLAFVKTRVAHDGYTVDYKTVVRCPIADGIRGFFLALVSLGALQSTDEVRFVEEWQHKMYRILPFNLELSSTYLWPLRVDVLPRDHRRTGARAVSAFHTRMEAGASTAFGCPFYFPAFQDEKFVETKVRLREVLKLSDEEFGRLKFSVTYTYAAVAGEELLDNDVIWRLVGANSSLVIMHPAVGKAADAKQKKKKRAKEQAIRIYN